MFSRIEIYDLEYLGLRSFAEHFSKFNWDTLLFFHNQNRMRVKRDTKNFSVDNLTGAHWLEFDGLMANLNDLLNQLNINPIGNRSGARWRVEPEEISQHTPGRQGPQQNWIILSVLRSPRKELGQ